ncbi:MAG: alpha/beta fold hydrolase [Acidobacteriota bacterium]
MLAEPKKLTVKVTERDSVTALLYAAAKKNRLGITVILGHGAGANQLSAFMRLFAGGLAARGLDALTFNFLYTEQGRGAPDHKTKLEACYSAIIEATRQHKTLKANRLVIGGKSMGGRIASQVAAANGEGIAALVFLGYPLHPPGNPEKMRDAHLKDIKAPMLFMQGSRDAFGTADELRAVIKTLHLPATLHLIEGADHSFKVPKRSPLTQDQVYELAMDEIARWVKG